MGLSRGFVLNRAFAADRWLQQNYGVQIMEASEIQLAAFLHSTPTDIREQTLDALRAFGDDMVRKGRSPRNIARTIHLP